MQERIQIEDALKHIFHCEHQGNEATLDSLANILQTGIKETEELIAKLEKVELIRIKNEKILLRESGKNYALQVIRAHRLYETHLAHQTGVEEKHWHAEAEAAEHHLTKEQVDQLAHQLGHPRYDPHGDPIPTVEGDIQKLKGKILSEWGEGNKGRIVHVEDEPGEVYSRIVKLGISAGMRFYILSKDEEGMTLNVEGREFRLDREMLLNLEADILHEGEDFEKLGKRLSDLKIGEKAKVLALSPSCRGMERNRLLDLGIIPGSSIEADINSPFGNPRAYLVRGALIALRKEQAEQIFVDDE